MNRELLSTLLVFFDAGVLMFTHADEPLKVDTQGVTAKILYEVPIDGGYLPNLSVNTS